MSHIPYVLRQWDQSYNHYNFLHFYEVFNRREVKEIIKYGEALGLEDSKVVEGVVDPTYRKSSNSWINNTMETEWIYDRIRDVAMSANEHFKFDLSYFGEPLQFTKYEVGQYYGWHEDVGGGPSSIRKLSVVINLSDPRSYTGGELQLFSNRKDKIDNSIGSAIVFPSYKEHRVTPVKDGTRYSLVSWISGPRFR